MSSSRSDAVARDLDDALAAPPPTGPRLRPSDPLTPSTTLTVGAAVDLFADMVRSRAVDLAARRLRAAGTGYYTIASAGHEWNAVLGARLRVDDPALLHYRSGALMMARSRRHGGVDPVRDTLLSLMAAADDPASGGRHKVWGSREMWVPPQTSTIGSHLPKAVGAAFALHRAARIGRETPVPADAIVCCSFGDASVNHAAALAGINAARYAQRRGSPAPVLFVCEDNGLGISVDTPRGWIAETFGSMPGLAYVHAEGEVDDVWDAVGAAVHRCRSARAPVFLHLRTVRLWGHAGSDVEASYRDPDAIARDEAADPIVRTAHRLVTRGAATGDALRAVVDDARARVDAMLAELEGAPTLASRAAVTAPLAPLRPDVVRCSATSTVDPALRRETFGRTLPEDATAPTHRTLGALLNAALTDELLRRPEAVVFGEDVGRKGGVYHVTGGLQQTFGRGRVFDTLLDETTILGTAQGAALMGLLPIPEIQYLAYVHNALDQLRGEACSTSFFSGGRFTSPMVVRIASFGYQRGFGGHFHNDDAIGALRDIPGLVVAAPARGADAVRMLRGCVAMAAEDGRVVAFLEPIALYHQRDLHTEGDGGWLSDYPPPGSALLPGEVGVHGAGNADVVVFTYANGLRMSLRAARRLVHEHVRVRVVDLRWLNPLPLEAIDHHADACAAVVVADECRATGGGIADAVVAHLAERGYDRPLRSVRSADSYVPLGPAADLVLLAEDDVVAAVRAVVAPPAVTPGPPAAARSPRPR